MMLLVLLLFLLLVRANEPFVRGPFQVERSFALLFAAPVSAEISAVARVLNLQLNVTCHGTYAGSDVDDIELLLQTPLTKLDQAYKFSGIDVRAAGLRTSGNRRRSSSPPTAPERSKRTGWLDSHSTCSTCGDRWRDCAIRFTCASSS
jgi:hypothetical protein